MTTIFTWLFRFVAFVSFLMVLGVAGGVAVLAYFVSAIEEVEPLPSNIVLTVAPSGRLAEGPTPDPLQELLSDSDRLSLLDLVDGLDRASLDPRVRGLVADLSSAELGYAEAQEFRAAVARFRATGRFAYAFADSFEGAGPTPVYLLASGFERIFLQPSGVLDLSGPLLEMPFLANALDEWGVVRQFDERHEYKGAAAPLTGSSLPFAVRQNYQRLVDSLYQRATAEIATARRLGTQAVDTMFRQSPMAAGEAVGNGLVDRLLYRDEVRDVALTNAGGDAERVTLRRYLGGLEDEEVTRPQASPSWLAVIVAEGGIERGEGSVDGPWRSVGSERLSRVLAQARADEDVAAVILRIDSPGGSYVASDTILRELQLVRDAGKPVIATMSDIAASGGYFLALGADHVVAHPMTLTGSIGVVGGKVSVGEALARLGIDHDGVFAGGNATARSAFRPFDERDRQRMGGLLDAIYRDFTQKVAVARRLEPDEIDAVARGRVFTGDDALRLGLIDATGGYEEVRTLARAALGLQPNDAVRFTPYPLPEDPVEAVVDRLIDRDFFRSIGLLEEIASIAHYIRGVIGPITGVGGVVRGDTVSATAPVGPVR